MRAVVFAYSNVGDRCLRVLHARGVEVPLVVTHVDAPGEKLWFRRVADTAGEFGMPVVYAEDLDETSTLAIVAKARPDVIFSFYFRSMIPLPVLQLAPGGAFNMHGSLLPKYRGRAPTNWAVLKGEVETGATLHEMLARADAGDIIDQSAVPILPDDTAQQVFDKVTVAAEQVLWRSLPAILGGNPPRRVNDIARGSYFPGRKPEDGRIDWTRPATEVYNLIRAVAPPYPGAFTDIGSSRLVIAEARLAAPNVAPSDASVRSRGLQVIDGRIVGVCGDDRLIDVHLLTCGAAAIDTPSLQALMSNAQPRKS